MPGWHNTAATGSSFSGRRHSSRRSSNSFGAPRRQLSVASLLDAISQIVFGLTFLAVLLAFAGRTPIGQFTLLIGTGICVTTWLGSRILEPGQPWRWTGLEVVFALALAVIALQLAPLDEATLIQLAPQLPGYLGADLVADAIDDSASQTALGWNQLSLSPQQTRLTLSAITAVMLLFIMLVQRFQDRRQARHTLLALIAATVAFALFAMVQFLTSNGQFFWVITHPYSTTLGSAKGSFTNANHYAGFLSLAFGPLLAWTVCRTASKIFPKPSRSRRQRTNSAERVTAESSTSDRWRGMCGGIGLVILLVGVVLSGSRGGLLLLAVGGTVTLLLIVIKGLFSSRLPALLAITSVLGLGGIYLFGQDYFNDNITQLATADIEQLDRNQGRRFIWASNRNAQQAFPLFGTGLGTHRDVIAAFQNKDLSNLVYTHAENSYLQIGTELGLIGWGLFALAALMVLGRLLYLLFYVDLDARNSAWVVGISGSVAVFLVHGMYDFAWYAPAYMLALACLAAFLFSRFESETDGSAQSGSKSRAPLSSPTRYGVVPLTLLASLLLGLGSLAPSVWQAAQAEIPQTRYELITQRGREPDTPAEALIALQYKIELLQSALRADPHNALNHQRMASCMRQVFELNMLHRAGTMPFPQIRAAVYSGGFTDADQLSEWLSKPGVLQKPLPLVEASLRSSRRAIANCPFLTTAWLTQADLCFIESPDPQQAQYYLNRARRVQPAAAAATFTDGYYALSSGDLDAAIKQWQPIFHSNSEIQRQILDIVAFSLPPDDVIELFEPDYAAMHQLVRAYAKPNDPNYQKAAIALVQDTQRNAQTMTDRARARNFGACFDHLNHSGCYEQTIQFIEFVSEHEPDIVPLRKKFGNWLFHRKQYTAALPHLQYYLDRVNHDPAVQNQIQVCQTRTAIYR